MKFFKSTAAAVLSFVASQAGAHASLEVQEAQINANYKAVMRISHGCDGDATLKVRITIPEGVINAKPMPKSGWDLETVEGPYAKTYEYHGPHSEGVQEIIWTGELLDKHFDEFIFRARITDAFAPGDVIYFPTVQECAAGTHEWVEIPAEGQSRGDLDGPAPQLQLIEGGHAHH